MSEELHVRRYERSDRDAVVDLMETALRDADAYVEDAPALQDGDIVAEYVEAGGDFLVGELDGRIVATSAFRPPGGAVAEHLDVGERTAEVKRMHVHPDYQRRGLGQRMFDELEARARSRGFVELVLATTSRQHAAHAFYRANGFEEVDRVPVEEFEATFDLVFFRKRRTAG